MILLPDLCEGAQHSFENKKFPPNASNFHFLFPKTVLSNVIKRILEIAAFWNFWISAVRLTHYLPTRCPEPYQLSMKRANNYLINENATSIDHFFRNDRFDHMLHQFLADELVVHFGGMLRRDQNRVHPLRDHRAVRVLLVLGRDLGFAWGDCFLVSKTRQKVRCVAPPAPADRPTPTVELDSILPSGRTHGHVPFLRTSVSCQPSLVAMECVNGISSGVSSQA